METNKRQTPTKQSHRAANKTHPVEPTDQKHNDIWITHNRNAAHPNKKNGNLHVQEHKSNDEPGVERRKMVPGKQLYENYNNQPLKHGWKNTSYDNSHTNTRQENDTPKALR